MQNEDFEVIKHKINVIKELRENLINSREYQERILAERTKDLEDYEKEQGNSIDTESWEYRDKKERINYAKYEIKAIDEMMDYLSITLKMKGEK